MPAPSASNLNLWKKHLGQVPDSVWQQTEIDTLILADNNLSELSGQIGRLKRLRTLDLGHNQLTQLPDEIGALCLGASVAPALFDVRPRTSSPSPLRRCARAGLTS